MFKQSYNVIGVMSGTSLDGIDLAHIIFTIKDNLWSYQILESETISYSTNWTNQLKTAVSFTEEQLEKLNIDYTQLLAKVITSFIKKNNITNLDAVCSHGHTILHQPQNGFTLQIGNLPKIASIINQKVVCDFRVQDVKLGGQGAPLVPIGDRILFSEYDYCLNLGGFSNISFENHGSRTAFDISPVNTVLNFYANQLGLDYDKNGKIARSGKLNRDLLNELNAIEYYKKYYPKSLGIEFVRETIFPIIEKHNQPIEIILHTFVEHIAYQINYALQSFNNLNKKMLVTGGGAYNKYLMDRISFYNKDLQIIIPDSKTLEFKEALIFGLLGVLKLQNQNNVLKSVTGAKKDHCSGKIFEFNN